MKQYKYKKSLHFKLTYILLQFIFITLTLCGCSNKQAKKESEYNTSYLSNNKTVEYSYEEIPLCNYSTKLIGSDKNRNTNIDLACKEIDGTVINSGETFSFWKIVKETSSEKGYKEADAFDSHGNTIHALGGGICQISSTIYNAVLKEKSLEVIERHPHSNYVAYVPRGKDASVNYGTADFKFKNNSDVPIKIYARLENKKVVIEIYEIQKNTLD